jgi:hypothetical protein
MAIYYPPMYCDINSILKLKQKLSVEYLNGMNMTFNSGDEFLVEEIIGYGYNLKPVNINVGVIRIKLGRLEEYFEPIKLLPYDDSGELPKNYKELPSIRFKKSFQIEGVVEVLEGTEFRIERSVTDKVFHNLYSINDKRLFLRLNEQEFEEYLGVSLTNRN